MAHGCPWRSMEGAHPQPVEKLHTEVRGCLRGGCDPVGSSCRSRVLTGTCGSVERRAHAGAGRICDLVVDPQGAVSEEL